MQLIKEPSVQEHYQEDGGAGLTTSNITTIEKHKIKKWKWNKKPHKYRALLWKKMIIIPLVDVDCMNFLYIGNKTYKPHLIIWTQAFPLKILKVCTLQKKVQSWPQSYSNLIYATEGAPNCASVISSEGALIAITPYDYPQGRPLFEHTPVLDNNLSINVTMTLVTMITIMTDITKITRNVKWHEMWNDTKCQMTQNVKWHKMSNETKWKIKRNDTWHMTYDTWQITNDT